MAPQGVAICWGLKEPAYGGAPLLPALGQVLPQELVALEQQVTHCHAAHGSEITFYWCFPFGSWPQLQLQGISSLGLEISRQLKDSAAHVLVDCRQALA